MQSWKERQLLARWFAVMDSHARTRITLANVKYDLGKRERLPLRRLLRILREMIHRRYWEPGTGSHNDAEGAFDLYLNKAPASLFCKGPTISNREKLSLITDDAAFHKYYVRLSPTASVVDRKARVPKLTRLRDDNVRAGATIQTGRAFAWVTDSDELQAQIERAGTAGVSMRVRDYLGLIFKKPKQRLIELRYPPDVAKSLPLSRPTVLEGACVTVYRSTDGKKGWGASLDLEHLCEGAAEAVHQPIAFTSAFEYRDLGPLDNKRELTQSQLDPLFDPWTPDDTNRVDSLSKRVPGKRKKP